MRKQFTIEFAAIPDHPGTGSAKAFKLDIAASTRSDALRIAKRTVWDMYSWFHFACATDGTRASDGTTLQPTAAPHTPP